jgi:solute carrier family 25 carnitine/acylcarnitine transporter 20/29
MAAKEHDLVDTGITFASGAAYGMTTVAVGQPFDTIKTVVQSSGEGTVAATRKVIAESGIIKGLWRGSLPLVLGGTFMRSAQFGCNDLARDALRDSSIPSFKIGGVVESHIVLAGMCGGLGRAVVEGPTEFFKIRQQIVAQWSYREALSGLGVTMGRNTGLFSAFVVYMDLLRPYLGDSPFVYGATCSNLAWLTVWPCVEINQCVGCTRQFFSKSFRGDDAAVLAPSSGEEPTSPRRRAGGASMAWRSTRRFSTNVP